MLKVQISQISMFKQVKLNLRQTFCSLSEYYSYCHHIDFQSSLQEPFCHFWGCCESKDERKDLLRI